MDNMNKAHRWNSFAHWFTIICTGLMAISAVVACSSQGANILHWLDDMVRMPTYVREVVTRTSTAIGVFDATNQLRFDQLKELVVTGDSNTIGRVECLHVQFERMSNSNDSDHALIRANLRAVMKTLDAMTNHPPIMWPQEYGLLLKLNAKTN